MNYNEMFVKIAFISFKRKLSEYPIADAINIDECLEKIAADVSDASDAAKKVPDGYWSKFKNYMSGVKTDAAEFAGNVKKNVTDKAQAARAAMTPANAASFGREVVDETAQGYKNFAKQMYWGQETAPTMMQRTGLGDVSPRTAVRHTGRAMRRGLMPGAIIGAGISAYRGGDTKDVATGAATGAAAGAAASTLLPRAMGGARMSPVRTTLSRAPSRLMGALAASQGVYALGRDRHEGEGFFESMGRRGGNIAESGLSFASPAGRVGKAVRALDMLQLGGLAGGAAAHATGMSGLGNMLLSVPTLGDVGGAIGKGMDTVATGTRKLFGGGKSYKARKAEALGKGPALGQPPSQRLEGQQFVHRPEYK
jgi:hypothetical protein